MPLLAQASSSPARRSGSADGRGATRGRRIALAALLLAIGAGLSELVAVQAVLGDATITASVLHLMSVLLVGGWVLAISAAERRHPLMMQRALVCALCAPVLGGIVVVALGLPAFRVQPVRRAPRERPMHRSGDARLPRRGLHRDEPASGAHAAGLI